MYDFFLGGAAPSSSPVVIRFRFGCSAASTAATAAAAAAGSSFEADLDRAARRNAPRAHLQERVDQQSVQFLAPQVRVHRVGLAHFHVRICRVQLVESDVENLLLELDRELSKQLGHNSRQFASNTRDISHICQEYISLFLSDL